jgi:hypothetical protein
LEQHLAEMQEWYRRKLRDLTEQFGDGSAVAEDPASESEPIVLKWKAPTGAGDRQLGELLRANHLVDAETLQALLIEAHKQRRSLRQVLLSSGCITLYQLALIEAGNLDRLMVGPVRVLDRVRVTAQESVYRVHDPRRVWKLNPDGSALLRHLSEAEMANAVHPDEFRQRFVAASAIVHAQVARTYEVLEIENRPAALQEWLVGLPAAEIPPVFAAPGVCLRLLTQATLALKVVHAAGMAHGRLHDHSFFLTPDGVLKLCGIGEPPWLAPIVTDVPNAAEADVRSDLVALGRIATAWLPAGKSHRRGKSRAASDRLRSIIQQLAADDSSSHYADASALLENLELVSEDLPANAEAWEQLLRHVRASIGDERADRPALAG